MIKLATVFSGIGAIEHALERMGLDYKIIFACDSGDVDILSKKIENNILDIDEELKLLEDLINKIKHNITSDFNYISSLEEEIMSIDNYYSELKSKLEISDEVVNLTKTLITIALKDEYLNDNTKKIYMTWDKEYEDTINRENSLNDKVEAIKRIIKIENDYKRLAGSTFNSKNFFDNRNDINEYNKIVKISYFKSVVKDLKNIAERLSMLHEKINTSYINKELSEIDDYSEKKSYIDRLYENKENSNQVKKSYFANYNIDEERFHWNASFLDGTQYRDKVDLFVGGSPCQSFSLVGKQRGLDDTRGTLFYEFARLIDEIRPKVFIYENVKAILSNDNGQTWETMSKIFNDLGYNWSYKILNAKDYGIPQNRERVFVVGFRSDIDAQDFKFPPVNKLTTKMQDYLLDNVSGKYYLPPKGVSFVLDNKNLSKRYTQVDGDIQLCQKKNQQFNWHGDFVFVEKNTEKEKTMKDLDKYFLSEKVKKYVLSSGTKGFYSRPEIDLDVARPLLTSMHKMHRAGVDNYVTTEGRLRKLTPRECLRLMGFCDSFKIVVSDTAAYQQAGNSIVVDVLIAIMGQIVEVLPTLIEED